MELHLYPDGGEGWCLTWKEPLVDADGAIRGLAGISRDAPALSRPGPVSAALSVTLAYIDDHLDQPLRVPDLAAQQACRRSSSTRESGLLFGLSAGQYLSRLRIGRACDRLRHSGAPLSELALECGYADQAAFTRQFRNSSGLTPGCLSACDRARTQEGVKSRVTPDAASSAARTISIRARSSTPTRAVEQGLPRRPSASRSRP